MYRLLALCATVYLTTQASSAFAQSAIVNVSGKFNNNTFLSVVCTVGNDGQLSGSGVLYGSNPSTGTTFKYPLVITKGVTAQGKLILYGSVVNGP
jgi:hypothetical protein